MPGDELALLPPVSGGAAAHVRVSDAPLAAARVTDLVRRRGAGAVVTFEGTVRDVEFLDYEAYREMAEERIAQIAAECVERHGLERRPPSTASDASRSVSPGVVVAVSAAHREAAFAGARELIDRIKAEAPIWKRELEGGEARWVAGEAVVGPTEAAGS